MNLAHAHLPRTTALTAAVVALFLAGAAQASANLDTRGAQPGPSWVTAARPTSAVCDFSLLATWGTVTTGNSSANAAEYRRSFSGGHAGSANAAEAPVYCAGGR
jgi:hypothetical protein